MLEVVSKINLVNSQTDTSQKKIKFYIEYFFSNCEQIRSFRRNSLRLLKKSQLETSFFEHGDR